MSLLEFMRDHLALTIIVCTVLFVFAGLGSAAIVAVSVQDNNPSPTPLPAPTINVTPTPTPTPTPVPTIIVAPVPWEGESYDQFIRDLEEFYNVTDTPKENRTFPNPLTFDGMRIIMGRDRQNTVSYDPGYVPGHPETSGGSIVFVPTPLPCPTPTPVPLPDPWEREVHQEQPNINLPPPDKEGNLPGILAWDAEHSRGLYPYYTPGDHAVIGLRFVNNFYPKKIEKPVVDLVLKKCVMGQYIEVKRVRWVESKVTIPAAPVDQYDGRLLSELPGFNTTIYEFDVPEKMSQGPWTVDSSGDYVIEVSVYVDDVRACWISKQFTIV